MNETEEKYHVVINAEGSYSIWIDGKAIPKGWEFAGHSGTRTECLSYIESVWTDMRPLSTRNH